MPLKSVKEEVLQYYAVIKVSESTISRHLKNDLDILGTVKTDSHR